LILDEAFNVTQFAIVKSKSNNTHSSVNSNSTFAMLCLIAQPYWLALLLCLVALLVVLLPVEDVFFGQQMSIRALFVG
jgi:hypothetical protein